MRSSVEVRSDETRAEAGGEVAVEPRQGPAAGSEAAWRTAALALRTLRAALEQDAERAAAELIYWDLARLGRPKGPDDERDRLEERLAEAVRRVREVRAATHVVDSLRADDEGRAVHLDEAFALLDVGEVE